MRAAGPEQDLAVPVGLNMESGRLALFANARELTFNQRCPTIGTLQRPTLDQRPDVGVNLIAQTRLIDAASVAVIGLGCAPAGRAVRANAA